MRKAILYLVISVFTLMAIIPIQASQLSDAKSQKSSYDSKLSDLQAQKRAEQLRLQATKARDAQIEAAQDVKSKEYKNLLAQIDFINDNIEALNKSIKDAEADYKAQKELLKTRLRVMYENANISYLQTLMESKSIIDFLEKVQLMSQIVKSDNELLASIDSQKKDIETKKQMSVDLKATKSLIARSKQEVIRSLTASRAETAQSIDDINDSLREIESKEEEMRQASERLNQEIQRLMSRRNYYGGSMLWPVPGYHNISSQFGMRYHPITGVYKMHTGVDISAPSGTSIIAVADGTVIVAGWNTAYGNQTVIDHGGQIASFYGHQSQILVSAGQTVKAGQVIGRIGTTGYSTGPHLHFGIIKNGSDLNPMSYI